MIIGTIAIAYAGIALLAVTPVAIGAIRSRRNKNTTLGHEEKITVDLEFPTGLAWTSDAPTALCAGNVFDIASYRTQVMFDRGDEVELLDGRRGWVMGPRFRDGLLHYYSVRLQAGAGNIAVSPGHMRCIVHDHAVQKAG
jgi:hypothetical protein